MLLWCCGLSLDRNEKKGSLNGQSDRQVVRSDAVSSLLMGQCYDQSENQQLLLSEGQHEIFKLLTLHCFHSLLNEGMLNTYTHCSNRFGGS